MIFNTKSIRNRQAFWLLLIAFVPLASSSFLFFNQFEKEIKEETFSRLSSVRDLKVRQLNEWLDDREADLQVLSANINFLISENFLSMNDSDLIRKLMEKYQFNNALYDEIFLVDIKTGKISISIIPRREGVSKADDAYVTNVLKTKKLYIKDIYLSQTTKKPAMAFSMPIYRDKEKKNMLAILVMRIDLESSLFLTFKERTGLGRTGELLIVNQEMMALNQLNSVENSSLSLKIEAKSALNASHGKTGVIESNDYVGNLVLAAYTYLPRTGWGFIVKQDQAEVYEPLESVLFYIILLISLVSISILIFVIFLSKQLTQPILDITNVAKRIQSGEENVRNELPSTEELSFLAQAFNDMADSLEGEKQFLKDYLENIIDSMPSALICIDEKLKVVLWSREAEKISGVSEAKATGEYAVKSFPVLAEYQNQMNRVIASSEQDIVRQVEIEYNDKVHIYDIIFYPLSSSSIKGAVIRLDDITEQLETDNLLRHSQKMEALGKLTGGVAHDFNNMLAVIAGFAELLEMGLGKDEKKQKYAREILTASERAKNLTSKLLAFSRKEDRSNASPINLNDFLHGEEQMISKTLTAQIDFKLKLADDVWKINVDVNRLTDALINMCINAMHAMSSGGQLTISTKNLHLLDPEKENVNLPVGDYVLLSISDTGQGISREMQEKIFDPFFTTKGAEGTGLGLSLVYGFIQQSKGTIQIFSDLGEGSQFVIYFPRYENIEKVEEKNNVIDELDDYTKKTNNEKILVVDDEPALCELATEILTAAGYSVVTASSGQAVLEILKSGLEIDVLLSDVIMPQMGGYELVGQVKQKYPKVKIKMVSGYTDKLNEVDFDAELHKQRVSKPYDAKTLLEAIENVLK